MPGIGLRIKSRNLFSQNRRVSLVSSLTKRSIDPEHNTPFVNWVFGGKYLEGMPASIKVIPTTATLKISRKATSNTVQIFATTNPSQLKRTHVIDSSTSVVQVVAHANTSYLIVTRKITSIPIALHLQQYAAGIAVTRKIVSSPAQINVTSTTADITITPGTPSGPPPPHVPSWDDIPYEYKALGKLYTSGYQGVLPPR